MNVAAVTERRVRITLFYFAYLARTIVSRTQPINLSALPGLAR